MDPTTLINQRVEVIASYRMNCDVSRICMPYKMRYKNQDIVFSELGMRHPTAYGRRMVHVFDMSDGTSDYRLEFDAEALTWTLITIIEGQNREY